MHRCVSVHSNVHMLCSESFITLIKVRDLLSEGIISSCASVLHSQQLVDNSFIRNFNLKKIICLLFDKVVTLRFTASITHH